MKSLFLVVPKAKGEDIRKNLLEMDALDKTIKIERDADKIFIPVKKKVNLGLELVEREAKEIRRGPKSYKELVDVPRDLRGLLPKSFDVVGEIIVLKLSEELIPFAEEIGRAMTEAYEGTRTVAVDEGVKGDFRVRKIRAVYGDKNLTTVHRAYGISLEVDLSKCYFSPRIATETWRIAQQTDENETVVDMFCGVGPFALTIAKHASPAKVYAIDSNPQAIYYLERNMARNKIPNVESILGDSRETIKKIVNASRVIIDLPHSSLEYFEPAVKSVEKGTVHYYEILEKMDLGGRINELRTIAEGLGKSLKLRETREVRTFSPSQAHFVLDLIVS